MAGLEQRVQNDMSEKSSATQTEQRDRRWLRRNALKAVIILAAIGVLAGVAMVPPRDREAPPTEAPPVNVKVMTLTAEPALPDTFDLPAVVEPNRIVTIAAEVAGRVERIPPTEGDTVRAGDLLIQLNDDLIRPQFDSAEAQVKRGQIEFERMESLFKDNATSRQDVDNAISGLAISRAQRAEVQARLARTRVVAPLAGVLNDLPVEEGEYVQPGTPVAEVVEMSVVKVAVDVPERDIAFFAVGQKAEIFAVGEKAETFADVRGRAPSMMGTITFISELADQQTRSTRLEITLNNQEGFLRSGQIVRARLTRRILKDAILIPLLAVIPMEDGKAVYVANSTKAERRDVKLGIIKGDRVQIRRGLEPGEKLIVAGHRFVAPGQNVNVVSENE